MAGHLLGPVHTEMGEDHLATVHSDPHRLTGQAGRHRVQAPVQLHHGLIDTDGASLAEGGGVGMFGQAVQTGLLFAQHVHRCPPGHPVRAPVDVGAELLAASRAAQWP